MRNHNHISEKYKSAAHSICNLNYNLKNIKIPIFFHNLKNYNLHYIIKYISMVSKEEIKKTDIEVIRRSSLNKYLTFNFLNF